MLKYIPDRKSPILSFNFTFQKIIQNKQKSVFQHFKANVDHYQLIAEKWGRLVLSLKEAEKKKIKKNAEIRIKQEISEKRKNQILKRSSKFFGMIMNRIIRDFKSKYFRDLILRIVMLKSKEYTLQKTKSSIKGGSSILLKKGTKESISLDRESSPKRLKTDQHLSNNNKDSLPKRSVKESKESTAKKPKSDGITSLYYKNDLNKSNNGMNILLEKGSTENTLISPIYTDTVTKSIPRNSLDSETNNYFKYDEMEKEQSANIIQVNNQLTINKNDFSSNSDNKEEPTRSMGDDKDIIELFNMQNKGHQEVMVGNASNMGQIQSNSEIRKLKNLEKIQNARQSNKSNPNLNEESYQSMGISVELFNLVSVLSFKVRRKQKIFIDDAFEKIYNLSNQDQFVLKFYEICKVQSKFFFLDDLSKLSKEVNRRTQIQDHSVYTISLSYMKKRKIAFRKIFKFDPKDIHDDLILSTPNSFNRNSRFTFFI
jgi:hypothetical protein